MLQTIEAPTITREKSTHGHLNVLAFFLVHVACFTAIWTGVNTKAAILAVASYLIRMFAITAGYHRYFSHRTYQTSRFFQFVLGWIGCASAQKGPLWWAAHHRTHHLESDTPRDIHSPVRDGFWWAHVGWILSEKFDETDTKKIPDLVRFPELVWLNKHFLVPPVTWALACLAIGGAQGLAWGFFISTVVLWHSTFLINSAAHLFGTRRFPTTDDSRNNFWLAILTLGEGWHNNHHYFPSATNQGFYWWEIDVSFYVLKVFRSVGLVWGLRRPPQRILDLGKTLDQ